MISNANRFKVLDIKFKKADTKDGIDLYMFKEMLEKEVTKFKSNIELFKTMEVPEKTIDYLKGELEKYSVELEKVNKKLMED